MRPVQPSRFSDFSVHHPAARRLGSDVSEEAAHGVRIARIRNPGPMRSRPSPPTPPISRPSHPQLLLPHAEAAPAASFSERIERIAVRDPSYAHLIGAAITTDAQHSEAAEALLGAKIGERTVFFRGNSSTMGELLPRLAFRPRSGRRHAMLPRNADRVDSADRHGA